MIDRFFVCSHKYLRYLICLFSLKHFVIFRSFACSHVSKHFESWLLSWYSLFYLILVLSKHFFSCHGFNWFWNILIYFHLAFISQHSFSDVQCSIWLLFLLWLYKACSLEVFKMPGDYDTKHHRHLFPATSVDVSEATSLARSGRHVQWFNYPVWESPYICGSVQNNHET